MRLRNFYVLMMGSLLAGVPACVDEDTAESEQSLWTQHGEDDLWTHNGNVVPMCWDEWLDIRTTDEQHPIPMEQDEINAVKVALTNAIEQGWVRPTKLKVTWEECPRSGTAKHVRVKIVMENQLANGNTSLLGMATLTTPADRTPGSDTPGLRIGLPTDFADRPSTTSIMLHEFGHILGFGHEFHRPDGDPALDPCYEGKGVEGGWSIGPLDPQSIMAYGKGYCASATGELTENDIAGVRSIYGYSTTHFGPAAVWSNAFCSAGQECHLGDVDGDGKQDLIAFAHAGASNSYVWVGRAVSGGFQAAKLASNGFCALDQTCEVADVNGDGRADLVAFARGSSAAIWVAYGRADLTFGPPSIKGYGCHTGEVCKLADIDGNGTKDLVVFTHSSSRQQVWIERSSSSGFGAPEYWNGFFCKSNETCDVGDVDGDGKADVVAFSRGGAPTVWVGTSTGSSFATGVGATSYFCPGAQEVCSVADVDGDGRADLVSFSHDAAAQVWVARSLRDRLAFTQPTLWHSAFCAANQKCLVGDVGELGGAADIVAYDNGHPTNRVWVAPALF